MAAMGQPLLDACYLGKTTPTPLVPVRLRDDAMPIWCKLEYLNPSGSIKDRIALFILRKALRCGDLGPGGRVVEASSGSTSIAMALVCAQCNLQFTAVMPEGVSAERIKMISAYGAAIELTPSERGIIGALERAEVLARETGAFYPQQFANPDNAETHRRWTAHEIITALPGGEVDAVVSGVGTGGTIVGLYRGFVDHGCQVLPAVAKPREGKSLGEVECCSFSSRIPGVVDGLSTLFREDELPGLRIIDVPDEMAIDATRELIRMGFPVGPSSGLNYAAGQLLRQQHDGPLTTIVTVFPDRMERYFSTELFSGS